jgi:ubiquinone/menaquinone biosynthesis C-methylase UbiE
MPNKAKVPPYEPLLAAYHRALAVELRAMIAALPIEPGQTLLDMACGDGFYSPCLAERVGKQGRVVAVDVNLEYLELARNEAAKSPLAGIIDFKAAPIDALPFSNGSFDFCWCAQSLYSLPDPVDALRHLLRVTRPGGYVAVLEGDTLHHVVLPWPIEVELAVRAAEFEAIARTSAMPRKYYLGRQLRRVFREAGLERIEARTFVTDRAAPLAPEDRAFLAEYLKSLFKRVTPFLDGSIRDRFARLVDPQSSESLMDDQDLMATCIDQVVWGRKPREKE